MKRYLGKPVDMTNEEYEAVLHWILDYPQRRSEVAAERINNVQEDLANEWEDHDEQP